MAVETKKLTRVDLIPTFVREGYRPQRGRLAGRTAVGNRASHTLRVVEREGRESALAAPLTLSTLVPYYLGLALQPCAWLGGFRRPHQNVDESTMVPGSSAAPAKREFRAVTIAA